MAGLALLGDYGLEERSEVHGGGHAEGLKASAIDLGSFVYLNWIPFSF